MITMDKVTEIYCTIDEFYKKFESEADKNLSRRLSDTNAKHKRNRATRLSMSESMTIIVCYHFGTFANFKHYYCHFILIHHKSTFPSAVSYNRFVELMPRAFLPLMLFMRLTAFGHCDGISFVDSTMIPVCHNIRRYFNKVFKGMVTSGKGTMGWCHGFKLHLLCNTQGEIITFILTGANVDDRSPKVWSVFTKVLYGKVFADRGYIKQELFEELYENGIHLVHGLKARMKNRLIPMYDKIMLRKRYIIECINELLKNKANLVHSRHRSIPNFIINLCGALTAYSFFDNKPTALPVYVEKSRQLVFSEILIPNWRS